MSSKLVLAIDFDLVLHEKDKPIPGRRMGAPYPDSRPSMIRLKRQGHTLIIHTTMANTEGGRQAVADWLKYYKIPYDRIEPKIAADKYIDDKAIQHFDWKQTLEMLR